MEELLKACLSTNDLIKLLSLSYRSLSCASRDDLKKLVLDLGELIFFDHAMCAYAKMNEVVNTPNPDMELIDVSYPSGYLDTYFRNGQHQTDVVFRESLLANRPVNWREVEGHIDEIYPAAINALDCGMKDGWAYTINDLVSRNGASFFFGGSQTESNVRTSKILEYIIPFFSEAYKRILRQQLKYSVNLTPREREVLKWVKAGKSSWDISMILNCKKRTVDYHVTQIKQKLNAVSRPQAVAIAVELGLIDL